MGSAADTVTILARDGVAVTTDCGAPVETATADTADVLKPANGACDAVDQA